MFANSKSEYLFEISKTSDSFIFEKPSRNSKKIGEIKSGERVLISSIKETYFEINYKNGKIGWIKHKDIAEIYQFLSNYIEPNSFGPLLNPSAIGSIFEELTNDDERVAAKHLIASSSALQILLDAAPHVKPTDAFEIKHFKTLVNEVFDLQNLPKRPKDFRVDAWRKHVQSTPVNGNIAPNTRTIIGKHRFGSFDCLISAGAIGAIARSIFRTTLFLTRADPESGDDFLWGGLAGVGQAVQRLEPLELLASAIHDRRVSEKSRKHRIEQSKFLLTAATKTGGRTPISWQPHPVRDAGVPDVSIFDRFPGQVSSIPCRFEQWAETERAVTCCGEFYEIDSVEFADPEFDREIYDDEGNIVGVERIPNAGCIGQVLQIKGRGFSELRLIDLDPALGAELGWAVSEENVRRPFNSVAFAGAARSKVYATDEDYLTWSDEFIEVKVPAGAVPGEVEVITLCRRNWRNVPISVSSCGFQQKFGRHRPEKAFVDVRGARFDRITIDVGEGPISISTASTATLSAEACEPVRIWLRVINAERVLIRNGDGEPLEFPEGDAGDVRTVEGVIAFDDHVDREYLVSAINQNCGNATDFHFVINRYLAAHVDLDNARSVRAGETISGITSVSCDPQRLGLDRLEVRLDTIPPYDQIAFDPPVITLESDQNQATFTMRSATTACARLRIAASASNHISVPSSMISILPIPIQTVIAGSAFVRITGQGAGSRTTNGPIDLTFDESRNGVQINAVNFEQITVWGFDFNINLVSSEMGTYDCETGQMAIPIELELVPDSFLLSGGNARFVLTTNFSEADGGLDDVSGRPLDFSTGSVVLVGAGTFDGGTAIDGEFFTVVYNGICSPIPPRCCI